MNKKAKKNQVASKVKANKTSIGKRKKATSPRKISRKGRQSSTAINSGKALLTSMRNGSPMASGIRNWATSNPTGATNEIKFVYRDYFDSLGDVAKPGGQYFVDLKNLPGINYAGLGYSPVAKVVGAKLYALPRFSLDSADSAVVVLTGLPINTAVTTEQASNANYAAQQSTLLTPSSTVDWVLCGSWDAKSTLAEANILLSTNSDGLVPIMEWEIVDPDFLSPSAKKLQFMLEYTVSQSVPQVSLAKIAIVNPTPWSGPYFQTKPQDTAVIIQPISVQNKL